jgi:hypothetical protein
VLRSRAASNVEQALTRPEPIQIADLREEASTEINEITMHAGYLARLVAPLIRDGAAS